MARYAKSIEELSKHLPNLRTKTDGVHPRAGHGWKKKFGWVATARGYNIAACRKDVMEVIADRMEKSGDKDEKTRLECVRLRVMIDKEEVELEQAELDLQKKRGELVERSEVVSVMSRMAADLRSQIEAARKREAAKRRSTKDKKFIDEVAGIYYGEAAKWAKKYL